MERSKWSDVYPALLVVARSIVVDMKGRPVDALGLSPVVYAAKLPATVDREILVGLTSERTRGQVPYELRLLAPGDARVRVVVSAMLVTPLGMGCQSLPIRLDAPADGDHRISLAVGGRTIATLLLTVAPPEV